jgi:hypothetical protein
MGVGVQSYDPAALRRDKTPGTHCTGGWVGPTSRLDGCGKSRPTGILSPDLPARSKSNTEEEEEEEEEEDDDNNNNNNNNSTIKTVVLQINTST